MRTFGTRLVESSWNRRWRHIGTEVEFRIGFKHRSLVCPLEYDLGSGKRAKWLQGLGLTHLDFWTGTLLPPTTYAFRRAVHGFRQ
jgi:hypothetical protein